MTVLQEQREAEVRAFLLVSLPTIRQVQAACDMPYRAARLILRGLEARGLAECNGGRGSVGGSRWMATAKARAEAREATRDLTERTEP